MGGERKNKRQLDLGGLGDPSDLGTVISFIKQMRADFDAHNHDGFNSRSFDSLIVRALIAQGLISGSSIYIPDQINPLFQVDSLGNAKVNSLIRNDFQWFTIFESIDGYAKSGVPVLNQDSVTIPTTNVSNNTCELQKIALLTNNFTWAKRRRLRFGVRLATNTNQTIRLVTGTGQSASPLAQHFGILISNGTLLLEVADGSGSTQADPSISLTTGVTYEFICDFVPGDGVSFYKDGVFLYKVTGNLPTGTSLANWLLDIEVKTLEAVIKSCSVTYWDLWQAN